MNIAKYKVSAVCDSAGSATAYTPNLTAKLARIQYVVDTSASLAYSAGAVCRITNETTGEAIYTKAAFSAAMVTVPHGVKHDTSGAAFTVGASAWPEKFTLANERVKIAITSAGGSAGNLRQGVFYVVTE